jgi:arginase
MDIQLFLVPYDTARRGWRSGAGPEHLLNAGLTSHVHSHGHFVADIQVIEDDPTQPPTEIRTAFELARRLASAVREARACGRVPLVLSGNCNSAVGTLSGLTPARRAIFWFDAHGDCNTPDTTATGFLVGQVAVRRALDEQIEGPWPRRYTAAAFGRDRYRVRPTNWVDASWSVGEMLTV